MKKIVLLFLFFSSVVLSQTRGISYQALIIDPVTQELPGFNNSNAPLANKDICLKFSFIDEFVLVDSFSEILDKKQQSILEKNDAVLIPHGTLIAQMNSEQIESIKTPIFGNKWIRYRHRLHRRTQPKFQRLYTQFGLHLAICSG